MSVLLAISAGLIVLPQLSETDSRNWAVDYPTRAIRDGKSAASIVRLAIDSSGQPYRCDILGVVGDEGLGQHPCTTFNQLRFSPAMAPNGEAVFSVWKTLVVYALHGTRQAREVQAVERGADMVFTVTQLPDEGELLDLSVNIHVLEDGEMARCEGDADAAPAYAQVACDALMQDKWSVVPDRDGEATEYVTSLKVRFTTEAAS